MAFEHSSRVISNAIVFLFVGGIPLFATFKKINVFSVFVSGAKEGFEVATKIIPYLVGFLVAIGMFRSAGGFQLLENWLSPWLLKLGFPPELLPLALIRPFSGSAANGLLVDIAQTHGGNSLLTHMAATLMGSTETTFYVVMVYFAAIGITRTRYAVPAGLIADLVGAIAAVTVWHLMS